MKTFTYTIQDELGIHARPAGALAKVAQGLKSVVSIDNGTKKADVKKATNKKVDNNKELW